MNKFTRCNECSCLGVRRIPSTWQGECVACGWVQPLSNVWAMPRKTGYAYTAPVGSFWRPQ